MIDHIAIQNQIRIFHVRQEDLIIYNTVSMSRTLSTSASITFTSFFSRVIFSSPWNLNTDCAGAEFSELCSSLISQLRLKDAFES